MGRGKQRVVLSNENLPYFRFGRTSLGESVGASFLLDSPMEPARSNVSIAREKAADCLFSNQVAGHELIIPNYSRIITLENVGFGRDVFRDVLNHAKGVGLVDWEEPSKYTRSIVLFKPKSRLYIPDKTVLEPLEPVAINLKNEKDYMARIDTEKRRELKGKLKILGEFYKQQKLETGLSKEAFDLFNEVETEIYRKEPLVFPDPAKIIPYMVFNDRDLTKGGRLYGAFWISPKKEFRRVIRINGELTCDIDGKGMHVQLLYRLEKTPMPDGDPYLFKDSRRSMAKKAMLLMMNTKQEYNVINGRKAVIRTYKKEYDKKVDDSLLLETILELEATHYKIVDHLYKPNWGRLQATEASIMTEIVLMGIAEGVVILPVHDGCLCRRSDREKVLNYFEQVGIKAEEHLDHLKPLPVEETEQLLEAHRIRIETLG